MNGFIEAVSDLLQDAVDATSDMRGSESSTLRLGLMLQDEKFATGLANADLEADDVSSMSASSWVWYLLWRSSRAPAPSNGFLDALFDTSTSPIIRQGIVESVLASIELTSPERQGLDDESPRDWISWRFITLTRRDRYESGLTSQFPENRADRALELASYLLEIDTDRSIIEIRKMLRSRWPGHDRLVGLLYEQVNDLDDDDEARVNWLRRFGIDEGQGYEAPHSEPQEP